MDAHAAASPACSIVANFAIGQRTLGGAVIDIDTAAVPQGGIIMNIQIIQRVGVMGTDAESAAGVVFGGVVAEHDGVICCADDVQLATVVFEIAVCACTVLVVAFKLNCTA